VCLVEPNINALDTVANNVVQRLVGSREMSPVMIDTRLDANLTGLRTAAEVESLIARTDVIITTRLHGMVLALKHGVPAVAIDHNPRSRKVMRQATAIGWPQVFEVPGLDDADLVRALDYCLSHEGRAKAAECRDQALGLLQELQQEFEAEMTKFSTADPSVQEGDPHATFRPRIAVTPNRRLQLATYPYSYYVPEQPLRDIGLLRRVLRGTLPRAIAGRLESLLNRWFPPEGLP
jgi:hypothetical protein